MITEQQRRELKAKIDALSSAFCAWYAANFSMMLTNGPAVSEKKEATFRAEECNRLKFELKEWIDKEL